MNVITESMKPLEGYNTDTRTEKITLAVIGAVFITVDLLTGKKDCKDCDKDCDKD